ncbi:UNVERIFIED_CONTAM: 60S ribosome subunit biogenesis protein NIP7 [Sesamum calycinum]|uniref:60S ribosome subunit biogenesis protein NIP7 n=1 Tax=Sesamum calycinum TaxID=2727403 RepID=A0AAW2R8H5_9LAMI
MRPLDEKETTLVFNKLHKFVGNNLKNIVLESQSHEGPDSNPGRYCFRLQKNRVYYVSESLIKRATNIKREKLVSLGTQIGKFTKAGKFHLTIQSLNLLAANAKHKVWLKPTSEMSFLYGNSVLKGGVGRITENIQVKWGGGFSRCRMCRWDLGMQQRVRWIAVRWILMGLWCIDMRILGSI